MTTPRPEIAIIGGSGFYDFLDEATPVVVDTPYGSPSEAPMVGFVDERAVAFLPRHGRKHRLPPHRVNYRANLWALRALGVRQILAPCAVGALRAELGPGTVVVPDQIIDRTWGREHTFYDQAKQVVHVGFADPYCAGGRAAVVAAGRASDEPVVAGGTLVVINGPRFSSRAESRWHASIGGTLVGMTAMPEAALARELALCFTTIALVTDADAGVDAADAVAHAAVLEVFTAHIGRLKGLVARAVAALPEAQDDETAPCACRRALDGQRMPFALP